jgi:hypothetical protein
MNGVFKTQHDAMLLKFQNPAEADQLTGIMKQLDETKLILVRRARTRTLAPPQISHAERATSCNERAQAGKGGGVTTHG